MTDPTFFDVALRQRACRRFAPDPVPDADIERILTAATHAPSGENTQPWRFVVVDDPAVRSGLDQLSRSLWTVARPFAEPNLTPDLLAEVEGGIEEGFGGAPVVIVVACDGEANPLEVTRPSSIFPCVQNLLLAAGALGYGTLLSTLTTMAASELQALLSLPAHIQPMAVVPLGVPRSPLGPPRRRPMAEVTFRNAWSRPWPDR